MQFSEYFALPDDENREWFDPILSFDTMLFIDPFLIYGSEDGAFKGSHASVVDYFQVAFELVAKSGGNKNSVSWRNAERLLTFPEVGELCLGYAGRGSHGAGSGKDTATRLTSALLAAVKQGIKHLDHFEEIQLFEEGIGPDRISDAIGNILRDRICLYTQSIAAEMKISVSTVRYDHVAFDKGAQRIIVNSYKLPINPYTDRPILLIPKKYLRPLPTINPDDYWSYCYSAHSGLVAEMFGDDITNRVDKETIIDFAKAHPETRSQYVKEKEEEGTEPYDFPNDPKGFIKWYKATADFVAQHPHLLNFTTTQEFTNFVDELLSEFRNYVENNGGWELLWNDNETPKMESAAQHLFLGIVKHYCKANDVEISPEVNIGRGPVDFKVSQGYQFRALIEAKLARNSKFWNGLEKQLPKYMEAESITEGRFLVICHTDADMKKVKGIKDRVAEIAAKTQYNIASVVVDARHSPLSASKL